MGVRWFLASQNALEVSKWASVLWLDWCEFGYSQQFTLIARFSGVCWGRRIMLICGTELRWFLVRSPSFSHVSLIFRVTHDIWEGGFLGRMGMMLIAYVFLFFFGVTSQCFLYVPVCELGWFWGHGDYADLPYGGRWGHSWDCPTALHCLHCAWGETLFHHNQLHGKWGEHIPCSPIIKIYYGLFCSGDRYLGSRSDTDREETLPQRCPCPCSCRCLCFVF